MKSFFQNQSKISFDLSSKYIPYFFIILLSISFFKAFFPSGFFNTHDGGFHLARLAHYVSELRLGQFPVRIVDQMAYGYSYPIFNFVYNLPYLIASFFVFIGFSYGASLKLLMFFSTILSVFVFFKWLNCHFSRWASLCGSIFFLYSPYRLLSVYVTGQIGTISSFLWISLIFLSVSKIIVQNKNKYLVVLAVSIAALITTHLVSAIVFLPLIILYIFLILKKSKSFLKHLNILSISLLLGLGISSFYLLPLIFESNMVKLGSIPIVKYYEHFVTVKQLLNSPWGYGFSDVTFNDGMSFQIGKAQLLIVFFALVIIVIRMIKKRRKLTSVLLISSLFLITFFLASFLMLPQSEFIWKLFSPLRLIQHPWRLLALVTTIVAFLASYVSQNLNKIVIIALMLSAVFFNRNHLRPMEEGRYSDEHYQKDNYVFNGSTDISWEFLPLWVKEKPSSNPNSILKNELEIKQLAIMKGERYRFQIDLEKETRVVVNKIYFPNSRVYRNDIEINSFPSEEGLKSFNLDVGQHIIGLSLEQTSIQKIGNIVSLLSVITLFIFLSPSFLKKFNTIFTTQDN